jgi:hypothetical protein
MQRRGSLADVCYIVAMVVVILVGVHATTVLKDFSYSLQQDRLLHEQMLKEHLQQLQDHEQLMEHR